MRRKDREVTDEGKIEDIISRCYCCRLGFNDNGSVYIVPLSFGYEKKNGTYTFYFHGASQGRKIDLIRQNPRVGFELDANYKLYEADSACKYSAYYQSIIGNGEVSILEDYEEKKAGLRAVMEHTAGKSKWEFPEAMVRAVCVFKLTVTELSCKEHM